jgi:hypothetical protein
MKTLLAGIIGLMLAGCYTHRELEAEMVRAEVIRIDTVQRYAHSVPTTQKQLTWRDSDNLEFITYVPMYMYFSVGTSMTMLKTK